MSAIAQFTKDAIQQIQTTEQKDWNTFIAAIVSSHPEMQEHLNLMICAQYAEFSNQPYINFESIIGVFAPNIAKQISLLKANGFEENIDYAILHPRKGEHGDALYLSFDTLRYMTYIGNNDDQIIKLAMFNAERIFMNFQSIKAPSPFTVYPSRNFYAVVMHYASKNGKFAMKLIHKKASDKSKKDSFIMEMLDKKVEATQMKTKCVISFLKGSAKKISDTIDTLMIDSKTEIVIPIMESLLGSASADITHIVYVLKHTYFNEHKKSIKKLIKQNKDDTSKTNTMQKNPTKMHEWGFSINGSFIFFDDNYPKKHPKYSFAFGMPEIKSSIRDIISDIISPDSIDTTEMTMDESIEFFGELNQRRQSTPGHFAAIRARGITNPWKIIVEKKEKKPKDTQPDKFDDKLTKAAIEAEAKAAAEAEVEADSDDGSDSDSEINVEIESNHDSDSEPEPEPEPEPETEDEAPKPVSKKTNKNTKSTKAKSSIDDSKLAPKSVPKGKGKKVSTTRETLDYGMVSESE